MAARVAKNIICAMLREKMKVLKVPSSEPYRQLVLALFNLFSGHSAESSHFWTSNCPPPIAKEAVRTESKEEDLPLPLTLITLSCYWAHITTDEADLQGGVEYYIYVAACSHEEERNKSQLFRNYAESLTVDLKGIIPMKCTSTFTRRPYHKSAPTQSLLFIQGCMRAKYGVNALLEGEWSSRTRREPFFFQGLFFKCAPCLCSLLPRKPLFP